MKTRTKIILTAVIFIIGSTISLFFTATMSEILSKETTTLRFIPPGECIAKMAADRKSLLLFLCLDGFFLMLCILIMTANTKPYRSTLVTVTPDIRIPAAVGQYQHGSAKFLNDKEKEKAFDSFVLDPYQKQIKRLIKTGYEDLDFLKAKNEDTTNHQPSGKNLPQNQEMVAAADTPKAERAAAPTEHHQNAVTPPDHQPGEAKTGEQNN